MQFVEVIRMIEGKLWQTRSNSKNLITSESIGHGLFISMKLTKILCWVSNGEKPCTTQKQWNNWMKDNSGRDHEGTQLIRSRWKNYNSSCQDLPANPWFNWTLTQPHAAIGLSRVNLLAMLASRRFGVNKNVTLTNAKQDILRRGKVPYPYKTGFSESCYSHQEDIPMYGTGQGRGNSPMIWCFLSSLIYDCYDKEAHPAEYRNPGHTNHVQMDDGRFCWR